MIETQNLSYRYNENVGFSFPDISCKAKEGLLILGSSGVGKSTLLHLLGGLMLPTNGTIHIDGKDITQLNGRKRDQFRGQHIGIVFQQNHFVASLSVFENIQLAQYFANKPSSTQTIMDLLSDLDMEHKAHEAIDKLSEGQKQRAAIARALINQPDVILADEPTSALDDKNCSAVLDLFYSQAEKRDTALIVVTHDTRLKDDFKNHMELV